MIRNLLLLLTLLCVSQIATAQEKVCETELTAENMFCIFEVSNKKPVDLKFKWIQAMGSETIVDEESCRRVKTRVYEAMYLDPEIIESSEAGVKQKRKELDERMSERDASLPSGWLGKIKEAREKLKLERKPTSVRSLMEGQVKSSVDRDCGQMLAFHIDIERQTAAASPPGFSTELHLFPSGKNYLVCDKTSSHLGPTVVTLNNGGYSSPKLKVKEGEFNISDFFRWQEETYGGVKVSREGALLLSSDAISSPDLMKTYEKMEKSKLLPPGHWCIRTMTQKGAVSISVESPE